MRAVIGHGGAGEAEEPRASSPARSAVTTRATSTTIERIHDGAIGDVVGGQVYWNQGGLWHAARKPEWTDTEWQIRNWLYFTWLSGDHIVEQHVHNIDVANWVHGRASRARASAWADGSVRTDPSTATSSITSRSSTSIRTARAS